MNGKEFRSTITSAGQLRLSLEDVTLAPPAPDEIIVRMEAAPLNPSDLGLVVGPADLTDASNDGSALIATVAERFLPGLKRRLDIPQPVGNEGAGTVIDAGSDVKSLIGKKVATIGGGMYAQYRALKAPSYVVLPDDVDVVDAASFFVNPLTALGFVETMRHEGHTAIVHTAAASNLGQMLVRICLADDVPLVNIVRSQQQAALLRDLGAKYVLDSTTPTFINDLIDAIAETGATIGFDATGGGKLASDILNAMEVAINRKASDYSRYGSDVFKQVYLYGMLDVSPTILERRFGFSWSVGGWLLWPATRKLGPDAPARMQQRVLREIKTTFASNYTRTISLADLLDPDVMRAAQKKATGEKFLINPSL